MLSSSSPERSLFLRRSIPWPQHNSSQDRTSHRTNRGDRTLVERPEIEEDSKVRVLDTPSFGTVGALGRVPVQESSKHLEQRATWVRVLLRLPAVGDNNHARISAQRASGLFA
eukprot:600686-Rhodomonas_salina.1